MQQQQNVQQKKKGIADVVFVIDSSGSMFACFEGVKENINKFVEGVNSNQQKPIDWRIAFLAENAGEFIRKDFTSNVGEFVNALSTVRCSENNEFTLPAIDFALDFNWRPGCNKIIVVFTDEPIEGGYKPEFQNSKLNELMNKCLLLKAMLYPISAIFDG